MSDDFRRTLGADTRDCAKWPYPRRVYVLRVIWAFIHATIWKLCWKRWWPLRRALMRLLGARIDGPALLDRSLWVEMPWNLSLGTNTALGPRVTIYNLGPVIIGDHSIVSQDAYLCAGTHDYTDPTYPLMRPPIHIGRYVWIAAGAFIGPGVTIGDGAVIGARAVVTRDVEPWTVVAGNPARVLKRREMKRLSPAESGSLPTDVAGNPPKEAAQ